MYKRHQNVHFPIDTLINARSNVWYFQKFLRLRRPLMQYLLQKLTQKMACSVSHAAIEMMPLLLLLVAIPGLSAQQNESAPLKNFWLGQRLGEQRMRPPTAGFGDLQSVKLEGFVGFHDGGVFIHLLQQPLPHKMIAGSQALLNDLKKLSTGDFIIGSGRFDSQRQLFVLMSIDTVGLQQVLGTWRSATGQIFEFRDFIRLNLYHTPRGTRNGTRDSTREEGTKPPNAPQMRGFFAHRQMTYTLAPESGRNIWSIFMADHQGVHIGAMTLGPSKMDLTLYDTITGQISEKIELSQMTRPRGPGRQ